MSGRFRKKNVVWLWKLAYAGDVILCLSLVAFSFHFYKTVVSHTQEKKTSLAFLNAPGAAQKKSFMEYAAILKSNPFGTQGGELKALTAQKDKTSPPRSGGVDVALIGTFSGSPRQSYAVFSDKNNKQEVFKAGQDVYGLGTLHRIERERVFLKKGAAITEIRIRDFAIVGTGAAAPVSAEPAFAKSIGDGTYIVDQQMVRQALERPNRIMTDARLLPNIVEGKQQGFVMSEVRPGGVYQSLGLKNGDILLRINEQTMSSPENAFQAFTALRGLDRVQLDIIRGGTNMTLTYQIR